MMEELGFDLQVVGIKVGGMKAAHVIGNLMRINNVTTNVCQFGSFIDYIN